MKTNLFLCGIILSGSLLGASAAEPETALESSRIKVLFDNKSNTPVLIMDKANNNQLTFSILEDFWFLLSKDGKDMTVASSNSAISSANLSGNKFTVVYKNPSATVTIRYSLGRSGHYLLKTINITPAFSGSYALKLVKTLVFNTGNAVSRIVHQHGVGGYTYFLRKPNSGYFFGVQVIPGIPISTNNSAPVELQYEANITLASGESYDAETSFVGCYSKAGHAYPEKLPTLGRCMTSPIALDDGEAEAVLAMVSDLAPNRHVAPITIHLNGWQSGITITEKSYQDPETKKLLVTARDSLFGPGFYFESASPWFGHMNRLPDLSPEDTFVPYRQREETEFLEWMRANGINSFLWTPTGQASWWHKMPRYCQKYEVFHLPGNDQNCIADGGYMGWLTRLIIGESKKGHAGWGQDEEGAAANYTGYTCSATNHTHIANTNISYACFHQRQKLRKIIRKAFGEDFEMYGSRPDADTVIWEALQLTTLCPYGENSDWNNSPLKVRFTARVRHFYHFVPSWMHQVILYPKQSGADLDKLMLSALAVSSSFLFGDGINYSGKDRIKYWLDWARTNGACMKVQAIYLPRWPSEGIDGYLRIADGQGFAFVFNDSGTDNSITIPLDAKAGLDPANTYNLTQIFPVPVKAEAAQAKMATKIVLKAGEYRLYSIIRTNQRIK